MSSAVEMDALLLGQPRLWKRQIQKHTDGQLGWWGCGGWEGGRGEMEWCWWRVGERLRNHLSLYWKMVASWKKVENLARWGCGEGKGVGRGGGGK